MENINVVLENGFNLNFKGNLFSETVCYEKETAILIHCQLYLTEKWNHVYLIRREDSEKVITHGYILTVIAGTCSIFDGQYTLLTDIDTLLHGVFVFGKNCPELYVQARDILNSAGN